MKIQFMPKSILLSTCFPKDIISIILCNDMIHSLAFFSLQELVFGAKNYAEYVHIKIHQKNWQKTVSTNR